MVARDTWLEEGITVLRTEGSDGLRIDRLATRLGRTKGSFHHHFRGAVGYRRALLERIENDEAATLTRIALDHSQLSAQETLRAMPDQLDRLYDSDFDRALRAWAARDQDARTVVARIDHRRMSFLEELWRRVLGPDSDRARIAALVPYLVLLGATATVPPVARKDLDQVFDLLSDLVTQVEP